jgi:hypothetical protein
MTVAPTSAHTGGEQHASRWVLASIVAFFLGGLAVALLYHFDVFGGSSSSTAQGSGTSATQVRHVERFSGVELAGSNNVMIHVGAAQSVVVRADDNLLDRVTTEVQGSTLVIGNTPGSFETKSPMSVEVAVPALTTLTLSGNGNIVLDGLGADHLKVTLPGNGTLTGSGTARRLDVSVGGSGSVFFTRLVANDVHAVVTGSGSIFVTASAALSAAVSGTGSILYGGNPQRVTRSVTGTGSITGS